MSKTTDRQQLIIEQLSDRRSATVPELMAQFNVSRDESERKQPAQH